MLSLTVELLFHIIVSITDDVQEMDLVKDVILVSQGIEGKLAKYDPKSEAYKLPDNVSLRACRWKLANAWLMSCGNSHVGS